MSRKFKEIKPGDVINDMEVISSKRDVVNNRRMLTCRCLKCGREKDIYEGNLRDRQNCSIHEVACGFGLKQQDPKFYDVWVHMKNRIYNPNSEYYYNYGGRGLTTDYDAFVDFYDDEYGKYLYAKNHYAGERVSLDRINNNVGYVRGNLRWTTPTRQTRNSRMIKEFYAVSPTGEIYLTNNQTMFAANHGLESRHISDCLRGVQATTGGGWRFWFKNQMFVFQEDKYVIKELYY